MYNLMSTKSPRSSSAELLSAGLPAAYIGTWGCPSSHAGFAFLIENHKVSSSPFLYHIKCPLNGSMTLWLHDIDARIPATSSFVSSGNMLRVCSTQHPY